ncbi:cation-translocating P-type ATPase [Clostridium massiliamazoniense]|uniref:cation-translocating P-type ATPase n=1 Tax=Clostridium massiliamazoniense TaxID=1347366 RepID=UPI0006D82E86|nr:cation-translocating P-type ATPase [Clostridium massiliamazoniense]
MKNAYKKSIEKISEDLSVDLSVGLNDSDVKERQDKYGLNELKDGPKKTTFQVFLEQFKDLLVVILLVAAIISTFIGDLESALVIFIVISINAILGTIQHIKAEQSLNSLKALSSPKAKVLRNGKKAEIDSKEIVPGDILILEAGDFVGADCRIIENFSLQVNESSLTGESENIIKNTDLIENDEVPIGDRKNMVFSGSLVTYGRAIVVATATGMSTELGKVAKLLKNTQEKKTPLQVNLDNFGKKLAFAIIGICIIVFSLSLYRGEPVMDAFMFAVALAVAAIPEALSSIVTIVLSFGTQKMAKENAIIRKLQAVEGLGSVSIICSDKTGTLTQNKMTTKKLFVDNKILDSKDLNVNNTLEEKLLMMSILCNDASSSTGSEIGDPTEVALVNLGLLHNHNELKLREENKRLSEVPFDSDRKLMSTVYNLNGENLMITKGALDVLLNRAKYIETSNGIEELTDEKKKHINSINMDFSKNGLRVLAFAYKNIGLNTEITLKEENDLTFVGLISMMDPPREESKAAVLECINAGIKPVMITGDHKITASAIAKEIGILKDENEAIEGKYLDKLSDEELKELVPKISVYARVSPEHKIRIVKAWQDLGNVVAMTGDGVNDAPALKQSDIGVAMGITGSEVAKDAASMVLTDDNFSTIVKAVENGRNIYSNIKKSLKFLLSGNTAGIFSVLYASILALPVPFAAVHLLFINLLTDSLPAIALGLEPHSKNVMKEKPRKLNESILTKNFTLSVIFEGFIIALCTMIAFHIGLKESSAIASTMAFATLCLGRLVHGFTSKSNRVLTIKEFTSNKFSWYAFLIGFVLLNAVLLIPILRTPFQVSALSSTNLFIVYGLSIAPLILIQIFRAIKILINK